MQASVVDGDGGLVGEALDKPYLLLAETDLGRHETVEDTDHSLFGDQWDGQEPAESVSDEFLTDRDVSVPKAVQTRQWVMEKVGKLFSVLLMEADRDANIRIIIIYYCLTLI